MVSWCFVTDFGRHAHTPLTQPMAIVLAAGKGTRMRSSRAKVLHEVCGKSMVRHVLQALSDSGITRAVVVTGYQSEAVISEIHSHPITGLRVEFVHQEKQLGTGHAVLESSSVVDADSVLIVNGDLPLITSDQIRSVMASQGSIVVASMRLDDPTGLGRIFRDSAGSFTSIVEQAEIDEASIAINEINAGVYRFPTEWLWPTLSSLKPSRSGETYLTTALARGVQDSLDITITPISSADGPLHVDSQHDLSQAEAAMQSRIALHWMNNGVTIRNPLMTRIDIDVRIGTETVLEPGTHLLGTTSIGQDSQIGPNAIIRDSLIGDYCKLDQCSVTGATLEDHVEVGPYTTLRSETYLESDVHLGTHVEIKNSRLGKGTVVGHFSYIGDADIGSKANIGAGAVTCNFDGEAKHRTRIGNQVFIGSDTLMIAPLQIGDDASTGAGSVVNKDVPSGARVVGYPARQRQKTDKRGIERSL